MTWKECIVYILQNNRQNDQYKPMHYRDITNSIVEQNLRTSYGNTPADTVNAQLNTHKDLFESLGDGEYRLTSKGEKMKINSKTTSVLKKEENLSEMKKDEDKTLGTENDNLIKSFGMYWVREAINWVKNPKLLGVQSSGTNPIDLSEMRGIYMLYDGREVIYVGQAIDRPILKRLSEHTKNRLSTRWDRFSWFGIDAVNPETLKIIPTDLTFKTDIYSLANALEGILIEGLEPRQNRRQGDNFGFEYYQEIDKEVIKSKTLTDLLKLI